MKFTIYQESRIGKRTSNQDRVAYCYSRDALLMVLADGMGGHLHGEVAAQIAVQYITEYFQREARSRVADPFLFLSRGLTNAHSAILDYAEERELPEAPRTTCVACIVQDSVAYWAHAGDSRLYVIRGARILAQTRDHSRVQMLIDNGQITEDEAAHHPSRNRVFSCLGGIQSPQIDFSRKTPLQAGDVMVLCTDGFWGPLGNADIIRGFAGTNITQAAPKMMDQAELLAGEGSDNLSLIAMNWEEDYAETTTVGAVQTQTMPLDTHTTQMEGFDRNRPREPDLTDDDIERAISEIRTAIQKYSK
ncbi:MAG TPA: protein phosphatase 2C domain-containing protein [Rhodocyclaceae bacterium]|nr:protein phosphatase 2C domain-containing protein [Rhodocyclaceae bacterium]